MFANTAAYHTSQQKTAARNSAQRYARTQIKEIANIELISKTKLLLSTVLVCGNFFSIPSKTIASCTFVSQNYF
jgi:hypothetical protein